MFKLKVGEKGSLAITAEGKNKRELLQSIDHAKVFVEAQFDIAVKKPVKRKKKASVAKKPLVSNAPALKKATEGLIKPPIKITGQEDAKNG